MNDRTTHHSTTHHSTTHGADTTQDSRKDPATLQNEVDEVRAHLEDTVDRLTHRLSPGELLDRALGYTREHGGEMAQQLGRQVKYNPVPLLLTSIGLTWLMSASSDPQPHRNEGRSTAHEAKDRLSGTAASVRDKARSARHSVGEQASDLGHRFRDRAQSAQHSFENLLHDQPLVAGALGVALGAAIGALLPSTSVEDDWLGDASDSVKQGARETARETRRGAASGLSDGEPRPGNTRTAAETVSQGHSPEFPEVTSRSPRQG